MPGASPLLVDAGTGRPGHLAELDDALAGARLTHVVVTHNHSDHASGAPALAGRYHGVRFSKAPWAEKDARYPVAWLSVTDGDRIPAGDTTVEVIATPGHAPDHICLWHAESRTLFSGDLALANTTVVIPASAHGDMAAYLASLERVLALEPARMLPAHGPVIEEPVALLEACLRHRRAREAQIRERLARGPATAAALAAAVYAGIPAPLLPVATDSLLAHLIKLEREGLAHREADTWAAGPPDRTI